MAKIIFLHNHRSHYRLPFFNGLKKELGGQLDFWFFAEDQGWRRYFFGDYDRVVLSGSHSWQVPFLFLTAKIRGLKIIFWTETWRWGKMSFKNRLFFKIIGLMARRADILIFPGSRVRLFYESLGINNDKLVFAPNASGVKLLATWRGSGEWRGRLVVSYLGRLIPQKGVHELIRAFRNLDQNRYVLVIGGKGEGGYELWLKSLAMGLRNVYFCGFIKQDEVGSFLDRASVVVYPSININGVCEAWGMVVGEALAMGRPVVATTAVAAAYDLINENETGYITRRPEELAEAIRRAANLPKDLVRRVARERLRIYCYERMVGGFLEAINRL